MQKNVHVYATNWHFIKNNEEKLKRYIELLYGEMLLIKDQLMDLLIEIEKIEQHLF